MVLGKQTIKLSNIFYNTIQEKKNNTKALLP